MPPPANAGRVIDCLARETGFAEIRENTLAQQRPERYLVLLERLFAEHGEDGRHIARLLTDGGTENRETARRAAHTLKGVAATFGMRELAVNAAHLHDRLDTDDPTGKLVTLANTLDRQLAALSDSARRAQRSAE